MRNRCKSCFILLVTVVFGLIIGVPGRVSEKTVINKETCTIKGIKLHGKVQIVDSFPDLKVKTVTSFPDLKVKTVNAFPDQCGEWQFVDSFPDFKIMFVDSFPDLTIQFVEAFPGVP